MSTRPACQGRTWGVAQSCGPRVRSCLLETARVLSYLAVRFFLRRGRPLRDSTRGNGFFQRIGYRADLEALALARLAELDVAGCRRALGELVARLDLPAAEAEATIVAQLLADVLQRVNERIHGPLCDGETYLAHRLATLERFADCRSAEEARRRFLPALNRLLAALQPDRPARHRVVTRAVAYIETNYPRRLSLSAVASGLAVSPSYLSRAFRRDTGETLTSYIQRVRIERAVSLVAEGQHSLSEIAYRVGYQTYRDFHRNFVRREHESPRAMRARLGHGRESDRGGPS